MKAPTKKRMWEWLDTYRSKLMKLETENKELQEENNELKNKIGLSVGCDKAEKHGELCLGYGGDKMTEETEPKELKWLREYCNGRKELRENALKNNSLPDFAGYDLEFWKKIYEEGKQAGATEETKETKEAREIIKGLLSVCDAELSPFAKEAYGDIFKRAEQFL